MTAYTWVEVVEARLLVVYHCPVELSHNLVEGTYLL